MRIVLLGPPGAGKGTQSKLIEQQHGLAHLSTGDMLRAAVAAGSKVGKRAKAIMERGELVPDAVVIGLIAERIGAADCRPGFILDGFPRTIAQADALEKLLAARGTPLDGVIDLMVDDEQLIERNIGRFTCAQCGEGYHDRHKRPRVEGVCDRCEAIRFTRRADDTASTVRTRLVAYHAQTAPLEEFYRGRRLLHQVDGMAAIDQVTRDIAAVLAGFGGPG